MRNKTTANLLWLTSIAPLEIVACGGTELAVVVAIDC